MNDLANEIVSDEEYLDSLLEKLSQGDEETEESRLTDEAAGAEALTEEVPAEEMVQKESPLDIDDSDGMSEEEMEAAADESLHRLLQEGAGNAAFDTDISLDELIKNERQMSMDEEEPEYDAGELSLDGLNGLREPDDTGDELLDSLNSIVQELHDDSAAFDSDQASGLTDAAEKTKKKKEKKQKPKKIQKEKAGRKKTKTAVFSQKLKDAFFKVETVDLAEEEEQEKKQRLENEEKKKAKAEQKEQDKAKKLEEKKAADAKKKEDAQKKKQEKERKQQEKKAKKAEQEAALGQEERFKVKPAFIAFVATIIAVMAIAVILLSDNYTYQNNLKAAGRNFTAKNYEEAYQILGGMKLEEEEQEIYRKTFLLVRLDKQYNSYVNFKNLKMDKEALNSLIQGITIYYAEIEEAKTLGIETEMNELKDTILYSLTNEYGLNEEKAKQISEIGDTNEYTKEIELYSASRIQ